MKKLNFLIATLFLLFLNGLAVAKAKKPAQCPTIAAIIAGGLEHVERLSAKEIADGYEYGVGHLSTYNTKHNWGFGMLIPVGQAVNEQDALNKAIASLKTLKGKPSPVYIRDHDKWGCIYKNGYQYFSGALTPVTSFDD